MAICLVSSAHISDNPRLVKEADALVGAGYEVTVVAVDVNTRLRELDKTILSGSKWKFVPVTRGLSVVYVARTALQRLARLLLAKTPNRSLALACLAHDRLIGRLASAASRIPAALWIAHNLAALPAAARAAASRNSRLGFDAEDFHTEELPLDERNAGEQIAREIIERELLPKCVHRTAASPLIAEGYRDKYGIRMHAVLNVFPTSEGPVSPAELSDLKPSSLYWFSQTIGHGRGLEEFITALSLMKTRASLYLRGNPALGYEEELLKGAEANGCRDRLHFLPPAAPADLVKLARGYALGLSLERTTPSNRAICLTNKLFVYLLAGTPVVLSRTPAHEEIADELGAAAIVVDLANPAATAARLDAYFADAPRSADARLSAWELGRSRFNWDVEKENFLACVARALGTNAE
jgi:glycosyltransferase involved in cell wall biosynthesis